MELEGIHHITAITENAQRNVDFYAGVMGLRLVKKTVNQDSPTVYHLFFADEDGDPGADLTFFEDPGTPVGRAGAGGTGSGPGRGAPSFPPPPPRASTTSSSSPRCPTRRSRPTTPRSRR